MISSDDDYGYSSDDGSGDSEDDEYQCPCCSCETIVGIAENQKEISENIRSINTKLRAILIVVVLFFIAWMFS